MALWFWIGCICGLTAGLIFGLLLVAAALRKEREQQLAHYHDILDLTN